MKSAQRPIRMQDSRFAICRIASASNLNRFSGFVILAPVSGFSLMFFALPKISGFFAGFSSYSRKYCSPTAEVSEAVLMISSS